MALPPKQFNIALRRIAREVPGLHLQYQKQVAFFALRAVVSSTPVDTGLARGNWQVGTTFNESPVENRDPGGLGTIDQGGSKITAASRPFGPIWIFNNVNYIQFLEEGSSQQAPVGMVASNIPRINAFATALGRSRQRPPIFF